MPARDGEATVLARTPVMRDALNATGRRIVYYVDVGGMVPTTFGGGLQPTTPRAITVSRIEHLPWAWAPRVAHMWKSVARRSNVGPS